MNPAGKQVVIVSQLRFLNPCCNSILCRRCNFKLNGSGGFLLNDDRPRGNAITVADVPYPQSHQIAGPKFAVQPKVKKRKLPRALSNLKSYPDGSDVFEFQRSLLSDDLSLVPWNFQKGIRLGFHVDLLKLRGVQLWTNHDNCQAKRGVKPTLKEPATVAHIVAKCTELKSS